MAYSIQADSTAIQLSIVVEARLEHAFRVFVDDFDVERPPEEVFAYTTDPARFHAWQKSVEAGHVDGDDPYRVGAKRITTRRIGMAKRPVSSEIAVAEPPRRWAVRGIDGPIRRTSRRSSGAWRSAASRLSS
jgi:hypothetical protein